MNAIPAKALVYVRTSHARSGRDVERRVTVLGPVRLVAFANYKRCDRHAQKRRGRGLPQLHGTMRLVDVLVEGETTPRPIDASRITYGEA